MIGLLLQSQGFQGNVDRGKCLDIALAWLSLFAMDLCGLSAFLFFICNAGPSLDFSCLIMAYDKESLRVLM